MIRRRSTLARFSAFLAPLALGAPLALAGCATDVDALSPDEMAEVGEVGEVSSAKTSVLDSSFGGDGIWISQSAPPYERRGHAIALQKSVQGLRFVVGATRLRGGLPTFSITRLSRAGTVVSEFPSDRVVAPLPDDAVLPPLPVGTLGGVAVDARDRIVAVGSHGTDFVVARYTPDGRPDTEFGRLGVVKIPMRSTSEAFAIATWGDGYVVGGRATCGVHGRCFALAKLRQNGSLDGRFGEGGTVLAPLALKDSVVRNLFVVDGAAPGSDYVIAVGGATKRFEGGNVEKGIAIAAFGEDGEVAAAFNQGLARFFYAPQMELEPANAAKVGASLFVTGTATNPRGEVMFATKFVNGFPDLRFGGRNIATAVVDFPESAKDKATGIAVDATGDLILGGYGVSAQGAHRVQFAHLTRNGNPDGTYDGDGRGVTHVEQGTAETLEDLVLAPDGATIGVGTVKLPGRGEETLVVREIRDVAL